MNHNQPCQPKHSATHSDLWWFASDLLTKEYWQRWKVEVMMFRLHYARHSSSRLLQMDAAMTRRWSPQVAPKAPCCFHHCGWQFSSSTKLTLQSRWFTIVITNFFRHSSLQEAWGNIYSVYTSNGKACPLELSNLKYLHLFSPFKNYNLKNETHSFM